MIQEPRLVPQPVLHSNGKAYFAADAKVLEKLLL
jgi:hypothetical protein